MWALNELHRWISEKLDGVRAYWDGLKFLSRHGKLIETPKWFIEGMPVIPLDGELWIGRETFEKLIALLNLKDKNHSNWKEVLYYIFDLPSSSAPFEHRIQQLKAMDQLPNHVKIVTSIECTSKETMEAMLDKILEGGGEGLMARQPHSLYSQGLSNSTLKVKVFCFRFILIVFRDGMIQKLY